MNIWSLLGFLFFTPLAVSFADTTLETNVVNFKLAYTSILEQNLNAKNLLNSIDALEKNHQQKLNELDNYIKFYNTNWEQYSLAILESKKKYAFRFFSPERSYLICAFQALQSTNHHSLSLCQIKANESSDEIIRNLVNFFKERLFLSLEDAKSNRKKLISTHHSTLKSLKSTHSTKSINQQMEITNPQAALEEFNSFMDKNSPLMLCNHQTPTINMEHQTLIENNQTQPGPLYQMARDDQLLFSTGTCYAHVAKDMLTAAFRGQQSPSFFDLANLYSKSIAREQNLDSGDICKILEITSKEGYCPAHHSLFEIYRQKVQHNPALIHHEADIKLLWEKVNFLNKQINKTTWHFYKESILPHLEDISNSSTHPLDQVQLFAGIARTIINDKNESLLPWIAFTNIKIAQKYSSQISSTCDSKKLSHVTDCNNLANTIYDDLEHDLKLFLIKNDLTSSTYHNNNKNPLMAVLRHPHYQQQVKKIHELLSSNIYIKNLFDSQNMDHLALYATGLEILKLTLQIEKKTGLSFFKNILQNISLNSSSTQQLVNTIAPACNNTKERRSIPRNLICETIANPSRSNNNDLGTFRHELFRYHVVKNLVAKQPSPIGVVMFAPNGMHIVSIVGMRYNHLSNQCQYFVRDSNGAVSQWWNEADIVKSTISLKTIKPQVHQY